MITRADKGGAVVICDVEQYIKEADRQLKNTEYYKEVPHDPTKIHTERVIKSIDEFKTSKQIPEKVAEGLKVNNVKPPKFYLSPKIHKEGNPGRPVISSINCHTSKISEYVDFHLQPHVKKLPSYTQDTTDLINKLSKINVTKDSIFVSMDVRSLYTNIPNSEGIKAVKETLEASQTKTISTRVITTFLFLILTLNNFIFNCKHYIQTKGCAMGTKCAPSYANIFMGKFEKNHIYPRIKNKTLIYLRYIDDIFFIWKDTKEELEKFFKEINTVHETIKFDYEYSYEQVNFLDTTIYKDLNGNLATKLYKKKTDRQSYLHKSSSHPKSLKKSIPFSQAMRIKRICSDPKEFTSNCETLKTAFQQRGYSEKEITTSIEKVNNIDRKDLLQYKVKTRTNRIPFSLTFNETLPNIRKAINNNWHILNINENLAETFSEKPIIAYKRNKNLRDYIGQTTIENNKVVRKNKTNWKTNGKCSKCLANNRTLCCNQIQQTSKFTSYKTNNTYDIYHKVNCKSKYVIYLMECTLCKLQYVGKSERPFNIRINNHRKDITKHDAIPVCKHFNNPSHNFNTHAKFTIIEQLRTLNETKEELTLRLRKRENFWINKLNTLHPNGLNSELNNIT